MKATDENGKVIFWSGQVEAEDGNGPVDPGAHFYHAYMLDEHGNVINKRNAWATRTVLYARTIPPGAADTVHFRLSIPPDCGDKIYLHAKLNYRKFNWWHTQWAYSGVRDPEDTDFQVDKGYDDGQWVFTGDTSDVAGEIKEIPNLPIVVMAEDETTLSVIDANALQPEYQIAAGNGERERWNDYGIGLFLQGDLKGAEAVFLKVTELEPGYMDGWVNVARCRIREGDMKGADEMLLKAFDPEDLDAHYNMMLCYRALKNPSMAAKEQKLYTRFKADESVDSITGIARRANPHANIERQRIHEHASTSSTQDVNY